LIIHDDGVGFAPVGTEQHGMGLRIMHHRARMIGATLEVQPGPHGGTCVLCTLENSTLVSVDDDKASTTVSTVGQQSGHSPTTLLG